MNVALFFGGKSCEHDISIITAYQIMANIHNKHNLTCVYVDREGNWRLADKVSLEELNNKIVVQKLKRVILQPNDNKLYIVRKNKLKLLKQIDAALLAFHGMNGEDGKIQGLLSLCGVPYTGCDVCASAITMDKFVTKNILKSKKLPTIKGIVVDKFAFCENKDMTTQQIVKTLGNRIILKPCNLGSSIGISVCETKEQLLSGLEVAFSFDSRCIAEVALEDFYELNCSVCKVEGEIVASMLERPLSWSKFLTFDEKYSSRQKSNIQTSRQFPYKCDFEDRIREMSKTAYDLLGCGGVVRIDYLVNNADGKFYINEINSIPGSLAYYLWEGVYSFRELIENLLNEAIFNYKAGEQINYAYDSDVLKNVNLGVSGKHGK